LYVFLLTPTINCGTILWPVDEQVGWGRLSLQNLQRVRGSMAEGDSFEASLEALEKIVQKLESGGVSLEDSLKLFEQGRRHAQICSGKLNSVERRIQVLLEDEQGRAVLRDFPEEAPAEDDASENVD